MWSQQRQREVWGEAERLIDCLGRSLLKKNTTTSMNGLLLPLSFNSNAQLTPFSTAQPWYFFVQVCLVLENLQTEHSECIQRVMCGWCPCYSHVQGRARRSLPNECLSVSAPLGKTTRGKTVLMLRVRKTLAVGSVVSSFTISGYNVGELGTQQWLRPTTCHLKAFFFLVGRGRKKIEEHWRHLSPSVVG